MNTAALTSFFTMPTANTSIGSTTSDSTGFGAIIEQLLATNGSTAMPISTTETGNSIMQLLLQLLGAEGMADGTGKQALEQLLQLLGGTQQTSLQNQSETEVGTDLTAMLMASGLIPTTALPTNEIDLQSLLAEQGLTGGVSGDTYMSIIAMSLAKLTPAQQQSFTQNLYTAQSQGNETVQQLVGQSTATQQDQILQLLKQLGGEIQVQQSVTQTQPQTFADTLARLQLTGAVTTQATTEKSDEPINLEALQQGLTANGTATQNVAFEIPNSATTSAAQAKDIAMQLQQSLQNLSAPKEFTVKLNPEGLGEITVSLTETAGRLSLALTATSSETARLLNSEIAVLQSTLKPYQSESEPIIVVQTSQSETAKDYISNGFTQQQQTDNKPDNKIYSVNGDIMVEQSTEEMVAQLANSLLSTRV